jgi:hypothetical protein
MDEGAEATQDLLGVFLVAAVPAPLEKPLELRVQHQELDAGLDVAGVATGHVDLVRAHRDGPGLDLLQEHFHQRFGAQRSPSLWARSFRPRLNDAPW